MRDSIDGFIIPVRDVEALNRVLKKWCSCFDELSTNGQFSMFSRPPPFALSLSKGERRVFQHPVKEKFCFSMRTGNSGRKWAERPRSRQKSLPDLRTGSV